MSNGEAIEYLIRHCNPDYPNGELEWDKAINMAISALKRVEMLDRLEQRGLKEGRK